MYTEDNENVIDFTGYSYNISSLDRIDESEKYIKQAVKKVKIRRFLFFASLIVLAALSAFLVALYIYYRGYTGFTVKYSRIKSDVFAEYESFSNGLIRYGKDGAIFIDKTGKERWNEGYHMKHPIIDTNGSFSTIADLNGNTVCIFDESGKMCPPINIALPVSGVRISENGVLMVVSEDDGSSYIDFYSKEGNELAKGKYPLDKNRFPSCFDISKNGRRAAIAFVYYDKAKIYSQIAILGFDKSDVSKPNNVIFSKDLGAALPLDVKYVQNDDLVILTGEALNLLENNSDEINFSIPLGNTVKSVLYNDYEIVVVQKKEGGSTADFYDYSGKKLSSPVLKIKYKNILLNREFLVLADEYEMQILNRNGKLRFSKAMGNSIRDIKAMGDKKSYLIMYENKLEAITLH